MTTNGVGSNSSSTSSSSTSSNANLNLTPTDFINMMVTQLQNQDPTNPVSNSDLLAQMSQIGQLQSQTQLQTTLTGLTLQNQIGSGATMIGKTVNGTDANSNPVSGVVTSVKVESGNVNLELDSGAELPLANVTQIAPTATTTTTATN